MATDSGAIDSVIDNMNAAPTEQLNEGPAEHQSTACEKMPTHHKRKATQNYRCSRPVGPGVCQRRARIDETDRRSGDRALGCRCCSCPGCVSCTIPGNDPVAPAGTAALCTEQCGPSQKLCKRCKATSRKEVESEAQQKRQRELSMLVSVTAEAAEAKARVEELTRLNNEAGNEVQDASLDDDLSDDDAPREDQKLKSYNEARVSGVLIVVRHEESVGNVIKRQWIADGKPPDRRPPKGLDHPLSERGAERLADTTAKYQADEILAAWRGMKGDKHMVWMVSPMRRALQTAQGLYAKVLEIADDCGVEIQWGGRFVEPLLVEHGTLKEGEGLTLSGIREEHSWLLLPGARKPSLRVV